MLEKKSKKKKGGNNERKRHCDLIFAKPGVNHCGQGIALSLRPANMRPTPPLDCWLKLAKDFAGPQTHFVRFSRNWQALLKE